MNKIRIWIGSEPKALLMERVLIHSIRQHTKADVEITSMIGPAWEYSTEGFNARIIFHRRE